MKDFEEASGQVRSLLIAIGEGEVNAYESPSQEEEQPPEEEGTFEAAFQSVQAALGTASGSPAPASSAPEETLPEMPQFGDTGLILSEEEAEEEEEATVSAVDEEGTDWTCVLAEAEEDFGAPSPLNEQYELQGPVEDSGELEEVHNSLSDSILTGKSQPAHLEGGLFHTQEESYGWELVDASQQIRYVQQQGDLGDGRKVSPEDRFFWVLAGEEENCVGYIHNGYVFLRKQE